jgi:hypothetical protein
MQTPPRPSEDAEFAALVDEVEAVGVRLIQHVEARRDREFAAESEARAAGQPFPKFEPIDRGWLAPMIVSGWLKDAQLELRGSVSGTPLEADYEPGYLVVCPKRGAPPLHYCDMGGNRRIHKARKYDSSVFDQIDRVSLGRAVRWQREESQDDPGAA